MKIRHTYLICRAAAFAVLLAVAGSTSVVVADIAADDRQGEMMALDQTV